MQYKTKKGLEGLKISLREQRMSVLPKNRKKMERKLWKSETKLFLCISIVVAVTYRLMQEHAHTQTHTHIHTHTQSSSLYPSTAQFWEWQTMTSWLLKHSISDNRALWLQEMGSDLPYTEGSLSLSFSFYVSLSLSLECRDGGGVGGKLEMFLSSSHTKVQYTGLSLHIHTHMYIQSQLNVCIHYAVMYRQHTYIQTWLSCPRSHMITFFWFINSSLSCLL